MNPVPPVICTSLPAMSTVKGCEADVTWLAKKLLITRSLADIVSVIALRMVVPFATPVTAPLDWPTVAMAVLSQVNNVVFDAVVPSVFSVFAVQVNVAVGDVDFARVGYHLRWRGAVLEIGRAARLSSRSVVAATGARVGGAGRVVDRDHAHNMIAVLDLDRINVEMDDGVVPGVVFDNCCTPSR